MDGVDILRQFFLMLIILSKCWSTLLYTSSDTVSLRIELVQKILQKNNNI
jgi:hypothetical protein